MECPATVQKKVCVEAKVTVTPDAQIGDVQAKCVGKPRFEPCHCNSRDCTIMVSQLLCVRFPIKFSAMATVEPAGIVCDVPQLEPCIQEPPCNAKIFNSMVQDGCQCLLPCPEEPSCPYETAPPIYRRRWFSFPRLCILPLFCRNHYFWRPNQRCR